MAFLNSNAAALQAISTVILVFITVAYVYLTKKQADTAGRQFTHEINRHKEELRATRKALATAALAELKLMDEHLRALAEDKLTYPEYFLLPIMESTLKHAQLFNGETITIIAQFHANIRIIHNVLVQYHMLQMQMSNPIGKQIVARNSAKKALDLMPDLIAELKDSGGTPVSDSLKQHRSPAPI